MPFRFWLWPLPTSVESAEAFQLALDWSAESCDPTTARTQDMLEPVSAIEPFTPCIPTCSFSPRRRYVSVGARCPRSAFRSCEV